MPKIPRWLATELARVFLVKALYVQFTAAGLSLRILDFEDLQDTGYELARHRHPKGEPFSDQWYRTLTETVQVFSGLPKYLRPEIEQKLRENLTNTSPRGRVLRFCNSPSSEVEWFKILNE